jgi:predicted RNA-binding Zn-ribbon protein involved in translation (DUF1610 family)
MITQNMKKFIEKCIQDDKKAFLFTCPNQLCNETYETNETEFTFKCSSCGNEYKVNFKIDFSE